MRVRIGDMAIDITCAMIVPVIRVNTWEAKDPLKGKRNLTSSLIVTKLEKGMGVRSLIFTIWFVSFVWLTWFSLV